MVISTSKRVALLACVQALLVGSTLAYDKNNRLVSYNDEVVVTNSTDL